MYWLAGVINKTIKDVSVFGIFCYIVAKRIKMQEINSDS
jgi:hypothetical protein